MVHRKTWFQPPVIDVISSLLMCQCCVCLTEAQTDFDAVWSLMFQILFLHLGAFQLCVWTRWRILVVGRLDLKLSEKQAEEMLDSSAPANQRRPLSLKGVDQSVTLNVKQFESVFLLVLISCSVCCGEEETVENSAPGQNLQINREIIETSSLSC